MARKPVLRKKTLENEIVETPTVVERIVEVPTIVEKIVEVSTIIEKIIEVPITCKKCPELLSLLKQAATIMRTPDFQVNSPEWIVERKEKDLLCTAIEKL